MGTFYLYLEAIFTNWWAFMMACPFIIDDTIKWIFPKAKLWLGCPSSEFLGHMAA
jgi:hypothetical protein